jgi:hypothetical protein
MTELTILTSGPKPPRLLATGKKKMAYVVQAQETVVEEEGTYKITLKIEGPDKTIAEEILGTVKLGDVVQAEFTPESPE